MSNTRYEPGFPIDTSRLEEAAKQAAQELQHLREFRDDVLKELDRKLGYYGELIGTEGYVEDTIEDHLLRRGRFDEVKELLNLFKSWPGAQK